MSNEMCIATSKDINNVLKMVTAKTLDVRNISRNGEFLYPIHIGSYHPDYRDKIKEFFGYYRLSIGSFIYQIFGRDGDANKIVFTEEQASIFNEHIEAIKKTPEYNRNFRALYNCYRYEITYYFNKDSFRDNWWITDKGDAISLNCTESFDKKALSGAKKKALDRVKYMNDNGHEVCHYEVSKVFDVVHFNKNESDEIKNLVFSANPQIDPQKENIPWWQQTRLITENVEHRKQDFKEITLKSSGRKLLFNGHRYGFSYVELDPIVTNGIN